MNTGAKKIENHSSQTKGIIRDILEYYYIKIKGDDSIESLLVLLGLKEYLKKTKGTKRLGSPFRKTIYRLIDDLEILVNGRPYPEWALLLNPDRELIKHNPNFDEWVNSMIIITADTTIDQMDYILTEQERK